MVYKVMKRYGCINPTGPMLKRCKNCKYRNDMEACLKYIYNLGKEMLYVERELDEE